MPDLESLHARVRVCTDCALSKTRTLAVPGEGSFTADLMFVGEGPGFNEDRQGRPFVGAAGHFLNELLASIGLKREEVFITNMVKCRPPNNRDPFPGEIQACSKYLDAQIEAIKPKVIVPLGRHALARWFPNESISKLRARPKRFGDITLFPLYHPAAALHNSSLRATIEQDFGKLGDLLNQRPQEQSLGTTQQSMLEGPSSSQSSQEPPDPPGQQLSMF